jgi:hypothetical protein
LRARRLELGDVVGLVHPFVDAHTLGLSSVAQLLEDCGYRAILAGEDVCHAVEKPQEAKGQSHLRRWIDENRVTHIGFSYRLDPDLAADAFSLLVHVLRDQGLLQESGGKVRGLFFAGLPAACDKVQRAHGERVAVFRGDEGVVDTLTSLGVPPERVPQVVAEEERYDQARLAFGRRIMERELPDRIAPVDRSGYPEYGTRRDTLIARLDHSLPPLMRAHVGPYMPNRLQAVQEFLSWCRRLAKSGYLDILSIGTSQLTQSDFGGDWGDTPNGGGVPINSEEEFRQVYDASRPMLVRTYAGTSRVPELAKVYEETLNIAWHALSLWWFSRIDGRGPNSVLENLGQHFETLRFIARTNKPFEPNIPHHFAFRGADDVTYVASAVLAARAAKRLGVRTFILQNMLNTPRSTWGLQDLAKARVMLALTRELEDRNFRVVYQPRAGLDYFSAQPEKAKVQLAAVSALMDDVEPETPRSPDVVHVVSYSEGYALADPDVVDESIRITRCAIDEYRKLRASGNVPDAAHSEDVRERTEGLGRDVRLLLDAMEQAIPDLYTPEGLYRAFWSGFLPAPYLWECRQEFRRAVAWKTRPVRGAIQVVDDRNQPVSIEERIGIASEQARIAAVAAGTVERTG